MSVTVKAKWWAPPAEAGVEPPHDPEAGAAGYVAEEEEEEGDHDPEAGAAGYVAEEEEEEDFQDALE